MLLRAFCTLATATAIALPAAAEPVDDLLEALMVPEIIDVMRDEGVAYGEEMAQDFIGGSAGPQWSETVSMIYDAERMSDSVRDTFAEEMPADVIAPLLAFFTSDVGSQIITLELRARTAMVNKDVEEEARAAYRAMAAEDDPRLALLEEFVAANDLLEANVAGALNASYQFYLGLVDGGAFEMTEEDILRDVWAQEEETREDTREWLYAYLNLAYGPLDAGVVEDYTALSATDAGRALNQALFAAFNQMYDDISYALGLAAAREMQSQDL